MDPRAPMMTIDNFSVTTCGQPVLPNASHFNVLLAPKRIKVGVYPPIPDCVRVLCRVKKLSREYALKHFFKYRQLSHRIAQLRPSSSFDFGRFVSGTLQQANVTAFAPDETISVSDEELPKAARGAAKGQPLVQAPIVRQCVEFGAEQDVQLRIEARVSPHRRSRRQALNLFQICESLLEEEEKVLRRYLLHQNPSALTAAAKVTDQPFSRNELLAIRAIVAWMNSRCLGTSSCIEPPLPPILHLSAPEIKGGPRSGDHDAGPFQVKGV